MIKQSNLPNQFKYLWVALLLIIIIAMIYGCSSAQKLMDKAERKDPEIVAKYARDKYPCTDLLTPDTTIIYKDSLIFVDVECPDVIPSEIVVKTDTIKNTIIKTIRVPVNLPVQIKYITKWYEDSAKLKICDIALNKAHIDNKNLQAANDTLTAKVYHKGLENWIWRIVASIFIFLFVWRKYKQLTSIRFT